MFSIWPALRSRRFLVSSGPWRAFLYVFTSVVVATPVAFASWLVALPWLVVINDFRLGHMPDLTKLFFCAFSALVIVVFGPLVAIPLGHLERHRLALVDARPLRSAHVAAPGDPVKWLRTRYTEVATWRELAYGLLFTLVLPIVYGVLTLLTGVVLVMLFAPLALAPGNADINLGRWHVDTPAEAVLASVIGLVLILPMIYLISAVAGGQASTARALLGDSGELREISRSRARLVDAFEAERRRIQRDLHDGAQHQLTSLTLQLGMARLDLPDSSPAVEPLDRAHAQAKDLMVMLRDIVSGISPQVLGDLGLLPALRELASRTPVPVHVTGPDVLSRPPEQVETTAYFVASEALGNVAKHAMATVVLLNVEWTGGTLVLEIKDDGAGGADPSRGSGLTGLADRVAAVDGRLFLASPPGGGTLVRVELPCR
jgi:signal transduction histidine kinase